MEELKETDRDSEKQHRFGGLPWLVIAGRFRIAPTRFVDRLVLMGAKYVPTIRDLKAGQRYQQKQLVQSKFIKPSGKPAVKKRRK
jgi:hypothetical protein